MSVPSALCASTARKTMAVPTGLRSTPPPAEGCQRRESSPESHTRPTSTNPTSPNRTGNIDANTGGPR